MTSPATTNRRLQQTVLHDLHVERGARMGPFAGYDMPLRYEAGPKTEHEHTRARASLFDVAHMGIVTLRGPEVAAALETLVPASIIGLGAGRMRYTFFTNDQGGIVDDLMVTNNGIVDGAEQLTLVVNAANRASDLALLREGIGGRVDVAERTDLGLLALQGPAAASALTRLTLAEGASPILESMEFLDVREIELADPAGGVATLSISRSGYTGEDGFELAAPVTALAGLARRLLDLPDVELAGLAARDSLRLEAGLCLYGHDLDATTSPIEAGLGWAIQKRRRADGGFPGSARVQQELSAGPRRHRVGLMPIGRKPIREGAELFGADGRLVGSVTSGGFGPTVGAPIAMGYVLAGDHEIGNGIDADVRGTRVPAQITALPFAPHRYHR